MSSTARFPTNTWAGGTGKADLPPSELHSRTHFFMRPHNDMRYLKMCNAAIQIPELSFILDIVNPRPSAAVGGSQEVVYVTYMSSNFPTAGLSHQRVARCILLQGTLAATSNTGIN